MFKDAEFILSDAPFVDTMVYNLKVIALNCVIKNEDEALKAESKKGNKDAELYIACREGRAKYYQFTYTREILEYTSFPDYLIGDCVRDPMLIPESLQDEMTQYMTTYFIEHYNEKNNYYRCLNGLPDYGTPGILAKQKWFDDSVKIKEGTYVHELEDDYISYLEGSGILSQLLDEYPTHRYLDHLGAYKIDPYDARKAQAFQLLYLPSIDYEEISQKFRTTYERNRSYCLRRIYSDAYKYGSDNYDNFITVYLVISTIIDMINAIPEFIARKEIFDSRCVRYIFESYGIKYYSDIPMTYQLKIIKNLNTLIKYKASRRNMEDICAIFGFNNIQIFKYYLLRTRLLDKDGNYVVAWKEVEVTDHSKCVFINEEKDVLMDSDGYILTYEGEDGDESSSTVTILVEDPTKEYELKFVKVPINDQPDEYIKSIQDHINYDMVTLTDEYWDGGEDHEEIKKQHLEAEFNYKRSKFISIDSIADMSELAFDAPYFFNMLYDTVKLEEYLLLYIPYISSGRMFRLTDIFLYLFAINDFYNNIPDKIYIDMYLRWDSEKQEYHEEPVEVRIDYDNDSDSYSIGNMDELSDHNIYISAFNLRPDMNELNKFLSDHFVTREDLGITSFKMPTSPYATYDDLLNVFETNKRVYKHITSMMADAETKAEYDLYKKMYDMLLRNIFRLDYFLINDGETCFLPKTYTEYLKYKDSVLYLSLVEIAAIVDLEERRKKIDDIVSNVIYAIDQYIDSDKYKYFFYNLPTQSAEYIKKYLVNIIEIFKSYKVQLYDINTIYNFSSKWENMVRPLDYTADVQLKTKYFDTVRIKDEATMGMSTRINEKVDIIDAVTITPYYE